ncbi:MAG: XRE family transcriptional regulator [Cytophagales bacterium]|nr:MAG: XRE family transcriptional regulator [Cytophagales bacterium]
MSQENMAELLKMSITGYGKIERDEVNINLERLQTIANTLETTPEEIIKTDSNVFNNYGTANEKSFSVFNEYSTKLEKLHSDNYKLQEDKIELLNDKIEYLKTKILHLEQNQK